MCPIRTIKGQYNDEGIPTYTIDDILSVDGYCPTNFAKMGVYFLWQNIEFNDEGPVFSQNGLLELDPQNNLCSCGKSQFDDDITGNNCSLPVGELDYIVRRPAFYVCKNNCPGGKIKDLYE